MSSTIHALARAVAPSRRVAAAALDDLLFEPRGWFAIDADNQRVARLVVTSREAGLSLIGSGRVASIVGKLRGGVVAVDVDVEDWRADWIVDRVAGWCSQRSLWHVLRPSGGPGRWHVIVIANDHQQALQEALEAWRAEVKAPASKIDLRTALRPLTAPHRRTGETPLPVFPDETPAALVARAASQLTSTTPGAPPATVSRRAGTQPPLTPRPRVRRAMPAAWQAYLEQGTLPAIGGEDHSRSTYEAITAGMLLRAGHSAESAWQVIQNAHPSAMTRVRRNHHRWIRLWNRAVVDDNQLPAQRPACGPDILAALHQARTKLWTLMPGHRSRTSVLRVALAVLERMERVARLRVPVPERDLILDTGIADRKTIRAALRTLHDAGIGHLHTDTLDPSRKDTTSYEFAIPEALPHQGLRQIPPPSSHNPPPHVWHELPATARILWTYLQQGQPKTVEQTIRGSGCGEVSPSKIRTTLEVLHALAHAGLVAVDGDGHWRPTETEAAAQAPVYERALAAISREREAYRQHAGSRWHGQRADALRRERERRAAWWQSLNPFERERRRRLAAGRFSQLGSEQQEQLKHQWALQRLTTGIPEAERHRRWIDSLSPEEYARRAQERRDLHRARPIAEQCQYARAWESHRQRWRVPRGPHARVHDQATLLAS